MLRNNSRILQLKEGIHDSLVYVCEHAAKRQHIIDVNSFNYVTEMKKILKSLLRSDCKA